MPDATHDPTEQLAAARGGDAEAFTALVEPYRQALLVHGYRLSGSLDEAEDLVQETFLRAWNKIGTYAGQGSLRNWLYVIATRRWLDEARRRKGAIMLPLDGQPADPETPAPPPTMATAWLDPLPDAWLAGSQPSAEKAYELRESVSLAFMVALQRLNPRQRAVLVLRQVFNWSAAEVAGALGLTVPSVNNHLYRARQNLSSPSYEETRVPGRRLEQFVRAWEAGDVAALIELLHDRATFAMPPLGVWYAGREAIGRALQNLVFIPGLAWRLRPTAANGRPAFGIYRRSAADQAFQAAGLILPLCRADDGLMMDITAFLTPQLLSRFGLPEALG